LGLNVRMALLGLFVVLAVAIASVALYESTARTRAIDVAGTVTSSTASMLSSSTCAPPGPVPNPLGGGGLNGGTVFTFVGGNATCIEVAPSARGSNSTAGFAFTLDATKQLFLTMVIDTNGNGSLTVPSGTSFTATVGSERFPVDQTLQAPSGVQGVQQETLFTVPAGNSTIDFAVSVPNPYQPGAYHFVVLITAWSDSTRSFATYVLQVDEFRANLVAK
jgi:hypothetical protein